MALGKSFIREMVALEMVLKFEGRDENTEVFDEPARAKVLSLEITGIKI